MIKISLSILIITLLNYFAFLGTKSIAAILGGFAIIILLLLVTLIIFGVGLLSALISLLLWAAKKTPLKEFETDELEKKFNELRIRVIVPPESAIESQEETPSISEVGEKKGTEVSTADEKRLMNLLEASEQIADEQKKLDDIQWEMARKLDPRQHKWVVKITLGDISNGVKDDDKLIKTLNRRYGLAFFLEGLS